MAHPRIETMNDFMRVLPHFIDTNAPTAQAFLAALGGAWPWRGTSRVDHHTGLRQRSLTCRKPAPISVGRPSMPPCSPRRDHLLRDRGQAAAESALAFILTYTLQYRVSL